LTLVFWDPRTTLGKNPLADEQVLPAGAGLVCQLPQSSIAMVKTCTVDGQNLHMFGGLDRIVNEQIFTL